MKRKVTILRQVQGGQYSARTGVISVDQVVMAESFVLEIPDQGQVVQLTLAAGYKVFVQGEVDDWLDDVPELWCVKIGERVSVDGLGQANYFHSRDAAQEYADSYRYVKAEITVCEVPEAARRWMMAGIRVW